jgi:hypothetical protein
LAGGVNLYAYAGNNPVAFADPFGLCPSCGHGSASPDSPTKRALRTIGYRLEQAASALAHDPGIALLVMFMSEGEERLPGVGGGDILESPALHPSEVAGKSPSEIDALAKEKGLIPKGPDPKQGQGSYVDPVTGKQRVLSHPNDCSPHCHVNNAAGERLDADGNVVAPDSPAAHLPIRKE